MSISKKRHNWRILTLVYKNLERVSGIEPPSSAWKADIMSHYTTPAYASLLRGKPAIKNGRGERTRTSDLIVPNDAR